MKRSLLLLCVILSVCMFAACDSKTNDVIPTKVPTQKTSQQTEAPKVTKAPEATAVKATATPKPTNKPVPEMIETLPDYYFDFTEYGDETACLIGTTGGVFIDIFEDGADIAFVGANDPYFSILLTEEMNGAIDPTEYKYMVLVVKASRSDIRGQIRFGTQSDNRPWSMIPVNYAASDTWQYVTVKFSDALYTTENVTLDGSPLTMLRLDPYDDETDPGCISDDDTLKLNSLAFFKTEQEAAAYTGIYKYTAPAA